MPDAPGEIAVTLRYSVPTDVVDLKTRVPTRATVTSTDGFVPRDGTEYAWDRQTSAPALTYRMPVNETMDVAGPIAGRGDYTFVDRGDWALVRVPPAATGWSWTGSGTIGLSRETTTAGPGAVGDAMAFLGEHREITRTSNGQTFRLIVPTEASLAESPTRILDSLTAASDTLRIGDRDDHVFVVAAPSRSTRWGVRGLQTGSADMWVRDNERLDTADNVWLHEYVHTRQGYTAATDVRWFTEASATYYAALLTLRQNRIGFQAFRDRLALGTRTPYRNAVLADPTTWDTVAPYTKGALVAGELDRKTRQSSDGTRSLQDVFSRMNSHGSAVTGSSFRELVRQTAGDPTVAQADRYTTTQETPATWDRQTHDRVFGTTPARISYALPGLEDPSGYRVSGPYRRGSVGTERPIRIATGETLTLDVVVSNTGGTAGEYDAQLLVNGQRQSRQHGRLGPSETRTLTFTHRFPTAGEYDLGIEGDRVAVSVRKPAKPTVTTIKAEKTAKTPAKTGEPRYAVVVTATVRNDHSFPAAGTLTLHQNGEPIETRRVELAPDGERTISYNETMARPGEHVYRIDGQTTTVTVDPSPTPTREPETTSTGGDGFEMITVLFAVVSLVLVFARRQ